MSMIYEPRGRAREYSPLALNVYSGGCDHGCQYCFCASIGTWGRIPKPRDISGLSREAKNASRQVMLCFLSDPYCAAELEHRNTRKALRVLADARCSVAILTKGGTRCLEDIELFKSWPEGRVKVGATLTFLSAERSLAVEPGAAFPDNRLLALRTLKENGIRTWASIEPVIDPQESLAVIRASLPFVDAYKVGKLNHRKNATDWADFGKRAVDMIRDAGRQLYVKDDLRPFLPDGYLTPAECNSESLELPRRTA